MLKTKQCHNYGRELDDDQLNYYLQQNKNVMFCFVLFF